MSSAGEPMTPEEMVERLSEAHGTDLPGEGPIEVRHLAEGHSNLTFVLRREGSPTEWILRRPPYGPLLPSAHDVLREFRILSLLDGTAARVPTPTFSGERALGAPYYAMERTPGVVVREELPDWLGEPERGVLGADLVLTLAQLHSVDPAPLVAARLGRPDGYVERQIARWTSQRDGVKAYAEAAGLAPRELPDHDWLVAWLHEHRPTVAQAPAVVHGDFKLDNVLVDPATATITAILDWEMGTVGDPLADLGYLLAMSTMPGEDNVFAELTGTVTAEPGFPSHADWIGSYADLTGRDLSELPYYSVLAGWKMAVLLEMSYYRFLAGTTEDPLFPQLEWGVPALLARARALATTPDALEG